MKRILPYILCLFFICSCSYDSIIKIDSLEPKGVLNAILNSDSVLTIYVSRTGSAVMATEDFGSKEYAEHYFINNAKAVVSVNGRPAGSMQRGTENGSYVLPGYIPEANDRVKIEVETDYGALTGEVQVPSPSPIVAIDTQRVASSTSDQGFFDLSVALTIEKETGKTTWYMLTIQGFSEYRKGDITLFRPFAPIVVHDGVRFYEYEWIGNRGNYWYEYTWGYGTIPSDAFYLSTYLFTDHTWNRPDLIQFILKNCFPSYEGEDYSYLSRYRFQLSAVSESYYLYMKSKIYRQNKRIFWEKPVYGNRSLPIPMWKEGMD